MWKCNRLAVRCRRSILLLILVLRVILSKHCKVGIRDSLADDYNNGEILSSWSDISGGGRNFENVLGDPRVLLSGLKGNRF